MGGGATALPANAVNGSFRPHCHHARLSAVGPVSVFWRMGWSISMQTIVLCIANPRYSPVKGSTWTGPHWQAGVVNRQSYWNLWPMQSGGMFAVGKPFLPMTPRSKCRAGRDAPQHVSGPMSAMNGLGIAKCHYPLGVSSARTGKASIPPITLAGTRDGSMQMATSQDLPLIAP